MKTDKNKALCFTSLLIVIVSGLMGIIGTGGGCSNGGGGSGGVASSTIQLNEVLFFAPEGIEWVELYNSGSYPANIDLFEITNEKGEGYTIPVELPEVPPNGYVVILFDGLGSEHNDYHFDNGFAVLHVDTLSGDVFDNTSDTCTLYSGTYGGSGSRIDFVAWGDYAHDGHYVNNAEEYGSYGPVAANETIGVHPDVYGTAIRNPWVIYAEDETTRGTKNAIPAPVPVVPFDNSGLRNDEISFSWRDWFINVKEYHLEVDDANDFSSPVISVRTESSVYHLEESLPDGTYYWRVKTITEKSEESSWSKIHAFKIEANTRSEPIKSNDLGVVPLLQRRDTYLLCPGCAETGEHPWDTPHKKEESSDCPHCKHYCGRACVAMVNRYFLGDLSQDRIAYRIFASGLDPAAQLGHGRGFSGGNVTGALAYALEGHPVVNNEKIEFEKIVKYIDEGRPLIGATSDHVLVIDGYDDFEGTADDTMHVLQPYTGKQELVKMSETKMVCIWAPPAGSRGITQENLDKNSDDDLVTDFDEIKRFFTDPINPDSDDDGLSDFIEIRAWVWGKGLELRRPFNGWNIWNKRNFDGDLYDDGDEDLNKNGNMDPDECDPFVAEKPIIVSLKLAGADGSRPEVMVNTKAVGRMGQTGSAAGYRSREISFLWCGTLRPGASNSITIRATSSLRDSCDDIQVRDIKIIDQNDNNKILLNKAGPFHLGDNTLDSIQEEYENGTWYDPNPPSFWAQLYGLQVKLDFSW